MLFQRVHLRVHLLFELFVEFTDLLGLVRQVLLNSQHLLALGLLLGFHHLNLLQLLPFQIGSIVLQLQLDQFESTAKSLHIAVLGLEQIDLLVLLFGYLVLHEPQLHLQLFNLKIKIVLPSCRPPPSQFAVCPPLSTPPIRRTSPARSSISPDYLSAP